MKTIKGLLVIAIAWVLITGYADAFMGMPSKKSGSAMSGPAKNKPQNSESKAEPSESSSKSIEIVKGNLTVAEVYSKKEELKGKKINVSGKVVKISLGILGNNWIHLQDGTGNKEKGTNDLTVTTKDMAKVDDKISISGILAVDKDFGAGYKYAAIVENASVNIGK